MPKSYIVVKASFPFGEIRGFHTCIWENNTGFLYVLCASSVHLPNEFPTFLLGTSASLCDHIILIYTHLTLGNSSLYWFWLNCNQGFFRGFIMENAHCHVNIACKDFKQTLRCCIVIFCSKSTGHSLYIITQNVLKVVQVVTFRTLANYRSLCSIHTIHFYKSNISWRF